MKPSVFALSLLALASGSCTTPPAPAGNTAAESPPAGSPVALHGELRTNGNRVVNADGNTVSLAGVSFFWSTTGWGQDDLYNAAAVDYFADDWDASLVRAAIAADRNGGYVSDPEGNLARAHAVIDAAIDKGLYVIADWHSHHAEDNPEAAVEFFTGLAEKYGDTPNIIYEIYNEPLDTADWSTVVKPYSKQLIDAIREVDPDNLILVGTQSWSQDVDKAAADPILGETNIAYTLHFYAASHKQDLRDKAQAALEAGLPLFVSEWGGVNYDGDGGVDKASVMQWMAFMRANGISHANWAVSDKKEGASIFKPGTSPAGPFTDEDLTESGAFVKSIVAGWDETPTE
ncbi:MAG: glycoside hydrolase family 5 protein [Henriciella sp.]|uniref:glycoside hydrolase family 5 protein n=1 Tax=Henriciella sp. TaxID=1968823 RepID=UPI003C75CFC3